MTILCITGMHRSGTSLTAAWLEQCGLAIADGAVIGPYFGNPKGHFEDEEFVNLHDSQIKTAYPRSDGWKVYDDVKKNLFTGKHLEIARELAARRNSKFETWGWKDPRTVLFLESWLELLPDLKFLFVWRPAVEVVVSLVARSRLDRQKRSFLQIDRVHSTRLWRTYNRRIVDFIRGHPQNTLLLPVQSIINKDSQVIGLLNSKFGARFFHKRIKDYYEDGLLQKRPTEITSTLMCKRFQTHKLESELHNLSSLVT